MHTTQAPGRIALVLLFAAVPAFGQAGPWVKQAPIPSAESIMAVHPLSATDIWCSAAPYPFSHNGHIAHTADAGVDWDVTELDIGGVSAVFFLDTQHGWTAGGAMRHTTDGGQTWVTDNTWGSIYDLFFLDTQHGWACGNGAAAYYTTDGGLNWAGVVTPAGTTLSSIWFQDALNGWTVATGGQIMKSTDGGQSWTLSFDAGAYLSTVQFVSPLEGWAIGGSTFLHTTDGGLTWTPATVPTTTWSHAARFFDTQNGVSVGEAGSIVRTIDGGQTWTTVRPPGSGPLLWDVEYGDAQTIVCSGGAGVLLRSTDVGATWSPIQSGAWGIVGNLDAHDSQRAWATNQGGEIVRTTNGGRRWERVRVTGFEMMADVEGIDFIDANTGWAVGNSGAAGGGEGRIARSVDGGATWMTQLISSNTYFRGLLALSPQRAIALGVPSSSQSSYLETTDGGTTWNPGGPQSTNGIRDAWFGSTGLKGWLVGDDIYHTANGGATWTVQYQSPGPLFAAMDFADENHGWATGYGGFVVHTVDGGLNWSQQDVGAPAGTAIMDVTAIDAQNAWVTGWYGFVATTTDGGASWQREDVPGAESADFECIEFVNEEVGWVGGNYGIYYRDGTPPCENTTSYCFAFPNSTGGAALMGFSGSCNSSSGTLVLEATSVPDTLYLFYFGPNQAEAPFGNGFRCVSGPLTRLGPPRPASGGVATRAMIPGDYGFTPGDAANFQCWFRDPAGGGPGFNLSDGLHVVFD